MEILKFEDFLHEWEAHQVHYVKCYIARLDIYNKITKDTFGGYDQSENLRKMPSLKWCEEKFKKQMTNKKLSKDEYWTIDVQVYELDPVDNELGELIEIIDLKEYDK